MQKKSAKPLPSLSLRIDLDAKGRIGSRSQSHMGYGGRFRIDSEQLAAAVGSGPVLLGNDANVAALAERWKGQATDTDNMIALLCIKTATAGAAIYRVDPREDRPAVQIYDDASAAVEWFTRSLRTSRKNGWNVVYDGLPLQG